MKNLILIICCLGFITAQAQYKDKRLRVDLSGYYNANLGPANYKTSDRFLTGQLENGIGFDIMVSMPVYHNIVVGVYAGSNTQNLHSSTINEQIRNRYYKPDYFNTITVESKNLSVAKFGIEGAYNIHNDRFGIEPYVRLGFAAVAGYEDIHASAHLKKKNENYFEEYKLDFANSENGPSFDGTPEFGFRLSCLLSNHVYLKAGLAYTTTETEFKYTETKTNLYNQNSSQDYTGTQPISSLLTFISVQVRIGKAKKRW